MIRLSTALIVCLLPVLEVHSDEADDGLGSKMSPEVESVLRWLPDDTETVVVSQSPFQIRIEDRLEYSIQRAPTNTYMVLGIRRQFWHDLQNELIDLAVAGHRRFRLPADRGFTYFEGCNILRFNEGSGKQVRKAFASWLAAADRIDELSGHKIGVFDETIASDAWTFYLANPEPRVLICATDREFLSHVLKRMKGAGGGRALPETLPEWKYVNQKAPVWAVRHYRSEDSAKDLTSPLHPQSRFNVHDENAVGLVFWYDDRPGSPDVLTARYLSSSPDAMQLFRQRWAGDKLEPIASFSQPAPDVVQVSLPRKGADVWRTFSDVLWVHLGHATTNRGMIQR